MKIGDIVIAPEGCENYLTEVKEYPIIKVWDGRTEGFDIIDMVMDLVMIIKILMNYQEHIIESLF